VYGAADVFTNLVNFLLVPLYTAWLTPADYGALGLLALFSTLAKILFRLGLDGAFFRVHYDLPEPQRPRLAGTTLIFSGLASSALFAALALGRGPLGLAVLGDPDGGSLVLLAALDVWLGSFAFVPLNLLRIADRPGTFSTFSAGRHTANIVLKIVLLRAGFGVPGVLWADALSTALFTLALLPVLGGRVTPCLDRGLVRELLAFGAPKVPHGLMVQVQNLADRRILALFVDRSELGLYHFGYTFGTTVKFALSAFEPAWGPFVFSQIGKPDAPRTLARVATYVWAAFVGVVAGVAALGGALLVLMTPGNPAFHAAAPIVPVVAFAYLFHGAFLLSSIGIGISKQARYYPMVTAAAALTNVAANFALIPGFGGLGAAWATVLCYVVMAALGYRFSQRLYPIPFEHRRLLLSAGAGAITWALTLLAPAALWPSIGVKLLILLLYPALLWAGGLFRRGSPEAARP
jgi:O-antigen/teichoic acid export membrane protein